MAMCGHVMFQGRKGNVHKVVSPGVTDKDLYNPQTPKTDGGIPKGNSGIAPEPVLIAGARAKRIGA